MIACRTSSLPIVLARDVGLDLPGAVLLVDLHGQAGAFGFVDLPRLDQREVGLTGPHRIQPRPRLAERIGGRRRRASLSCRPNTLRCASVSVRTLRFERRAPCTARRRSASGSHRTRRRSARRGRSSCLPGSPADRASARLAPSAARAPCRRPRVSTAGDLAHGFDGGAPARLPSAASVQDCVHTAAASNFAPSWNVTPVPQFHGEHGQVRHCIPMIARGPAWDCPASSSRTRDLYTAISTPCAKLLLFCGSCGSSVGC